jgi:hypothetical protein
MRKLFSCVPLILWLLCVSGCKDSGKPNMPVKVITRQSIVGEGVVAQFHNETAHQLVVHVVLEDSNQSNKKSGELVLQPNGMTEIGWVEGWKFTAGDTIKISHPDYKTITYRIL